MLNNPGIFSGFITASCTWPGAGERIIGYLSNYTRSLSRPSIKVHHTTGEFDREQQPGHNKIVKEFASGAYPEIDFSSLFLPGEGHTSSVIAQSLIFGLRRIFRKS